VRFEFDSKKSRLNWERHGIDFEDAQALWAEFHIVLPAKSVVRLITCHRADGRLEREYENQNQKKDDA